MVVYIGLILRSNPLLLLILIDLFHTPSPLYHKLFWARSGRISPEFLGVGSHICPGTFRSCLRCNRSQARTVIHTDPAYFFLLNASSSRRECKRLRRSTPG